MGLLNLALSSHGRCNRPTAARLPQPTPLALGADEAMSLPCTFPKDPLLSPSPLPPHCMQDSLSLHAGRHTLGGLWGVGMRACVIYAACVGRVASFATAAAVTPTQTIIAGHRALLVGPMRTDVPSRPPLVLLGGTAQWLDSWQGHLTALAQSRRVLLYETRGQGGAFAAADAAQADVTNCSLPHHAEDFASVLRASGLAGECDVCAFSFGGRVAMAAAALADISPARIRRLVVTGVAADRGTSGRLALRSWRASLSAGDLRGFVWRLILDTHSPRYLAAQEANVPKWVDAVVAANSLAGLRGIVEMTHTEVPTDPTHPLAMARSLAQKGSVDRGLLLVGEEDTLSPSSAARELADAAGWEFRSIAGAAHAVPIEQAVIWRRAVLEFLDRSE